MTNLFTKEEDLLKSAPIIGFEMLKHLQKSEEGRVSIFDLAKDLQKANNTTARSIYYGMIFLFSLDIVDFDEPYLVINADN